MRYRALLFDFFRTVVLLHPEAPTMRVKAPSWRAAMEPLRAPMQRTIPRFDFDSFLDALIDVTGEIVRARPPEYHEVPLAERYRIALVRCAVPPGVAVQAAGSFASLQMERFIAHTEVPPEYRRLLQSLRRRFRLAVVSNFDHAPTVRRVLQNHGLEGIFQSTLISDEFGRRKPHAAIFREALHRLDVGADEALFIGDSLVEDIGGAAAVGIDGAWIGEAGAVPPSPGPRPLHVLTRITDLVDVLADGHESTET